MKKLWNKLGWIFGTIVGSFIFGASYAIFLGPNELNAGGISGLAAVFVEVFNPDHSISWLSIGTLTILINLPLFAIGGMRIGKRFFFGSLLGMTLSSVVMDNLAISITVEPLLAALYGGSLAGIGVGLVFLSGASTGGADIVVRLVKLKAKNTNIGQISICFDAIVILLTGIVFRDINPALYTGIAVILVGKLMDLVVYGNYNSKVAMVVTNQHKQVAEQVSQKLDRGATYIYGQGSYSGEDRVMVLVAVSPKQVADLKDLIFAIDPNAFVILQDAHQVLGDGFIKNVKDAL